MSILDNFSDYTSILSLGLLNSPKASALQAAKTQGNRSPRHHSLLHRMSLCVDEQDSHLSRKQQQSRSIQKIMMPSFTSSADMKTKVLLKMSRNLRNKIRKLQFEFWVCFENQAKERYNKCKEVKLEKFAEGLERLETFLHIHEAKETNSVGILRSFDTIKRYSCNSKVADLIVRSIEPSLRRNSEGLFKKLKNLEAFQIKLEMFSNIISLNIVRKVQKSCFNELYSQFVESRKSVTNVKCKQKQKTEMKKTSLCPSFASINISKSKINKLCNLHEVCMIGEFLETEEKSSFIPLKQLEHRLIQSAPDQSDSNIIFLENPFPQSKAPTISASQSTHNLIQHDFEQVVNYLTPREVQFESYQSKNTSIPKKQAIRQISLNVADSILERPNSFSHKKHAKSLWNQCELPYNEENYRLSEKNVYKARNQTVNASKAIFSISQHNGFDQKIGNLQRKLFGENKAKQHGWKRDRMAVNQIMASLRQTSRREQQCPYENPVLLSEYLYCQAAAKKMLPKETEEQKYKISKYTKAPAHTSIKSKRLSVTSSMMKDNQPLKRIQYNEEKKNQRLTISLKNKRRSSASTQQLEGDVEIISKESKVRVFQPSDWKKLYLKQKQRSVKQK